MLVVVLALLALLLGAGAVVAYVQGTERTLPPPPAPTFASAPEPNTAPSPVTEAPVAVAPVTPLVPGTAPVPAATPRPAPKPAPVTTPPKTTEPEPSAPKPPEPSTPAPSSAPSLPPLTAPTVVDAGGGQTTIVTPFGTFQLPGPRPPFYPADQPWPPPAPTFGPTP